MAAVETREGGGGCASVKQVLGAGMPVCGIVSLRIRIKFNMLESRPSFQSSSETPR